MVSWLRGHRRVHMAAWPRGDRSTSLCPFPQLLHKNDDDDKDDDPHGVIMRT